jgi:hypothetical protein
VIDMRCMYAAAIMWRSFLASAWGSRTETKGVVNECLTSREELST